MKHVNGKVADWLFVAYLRSSFRRTDYGTPKWLLSDYLKNMLKGKITSFVRNICLSCMSKTRKPVLVRPVGERMFELVYPGISKQKHRSFEGDESVQTVNCILKMMDSSPRRCTSNSDWKFFWFSSASAQMMRWFITQTITNHTHAHTTLYK